MNCIDKAFFSLADEIRSLDEKELYYRMRKSFDAVPEPAKRGLMTFFSQYPYWGKLDIDRGDYEEIALKQQALSGHRRILHGSTAGWPITVPEKPCTPS